MTTVVIMPIFDANGEAFYQAIAEHKRSVGKTAGQAFDALIPRLDEIKFYALAIIQRSHPGPV